MQCKCHVLLLCVGQGPGHSRVQFCMASLLATLVLDDEAMEIIRQRGEGHLIFEATLQLVRATMGLAAQVMAFILINAAFPLIRGCGVTLRCP